MTVSDIIDGVRTEDRVALTEAEAKVLFGEIGIDVPDHAVVSSAPAAADAAERIGYPVVAKVASPAVQHKSEWADGNGVQIGLEDESTAREAAERIFAAGEARDIDVDVLIEQHQETDTGAELIVGGLRDRAFGPVVLVGLGGVFTEIFEDTSHRLAPLSTAEALDAVSELRAVELLRGYRSRPPADLDAIAETMWAIGDLVAENDAIAEVDVNPLLARDTGVVALDALVTLRD